ncbi:MAG TPA: hypothetical protein VHF25_01775 [Nitriliruptorales bacterium]|nr:hypothetical protein [Nitriliruptorales bacterium]
MAAIPIDNGLAGRLAGLDTAVDGVAAVDPALVHSDELGGLLRRVKRARDRLDAVHTRLLAAFTHRHAQRGDAVGNPTAWLRDELGRPCHHHTIHTERWTAHLHPDNTVTFTRPDAHTITRAPP